MPAEDPLPAPAPVRPTVGAQPVPAKVGPRGLEALAELGRIDFARHDLRGVLSRVATLARSTLVPGGEVSITLLRGGAASTAAFTGEPALRLDETQYRSAAGPCLDAASTGKTRLVIDMATETRWPAFTAAAGTAGISSSLSVPMPIQDGIAGALNIYSPSAQAFDAGTVELGRAFAAHAAVAIGNAHLFDEATARARRMREAMDGRAVVEQAKGVLMGERRCSADEAFEILRDLAGAGDHKVHEVATMLVERAQRRP